MYNFKIIKIEDNAEWWNPNMAELGASPSVPGSVLKRRVKCEVSNGITTLHTAELLIDEPFTDAGYKKAVEAYMETLPVRNASEGLEARVDDAKKVELYKDGAKVVLAEKPIIKDPIMTK